MYVHVIYDNKLGSHDYYSYHQAFTRGCKAEVPEACRWRCGEEEAGICSAGSRLEPRTALTVERFPVGLDLQLVG